MSEEPLVSIDGVEIELNKTWDSYRRPRDPLPSEPELPPVEPKRKPSLGERVDVLYRETGPKNAYPADRFRRFSMLGSDDQKALLREASDAEYSAYLQHSRPAVRDRIISERGHLVPGQGV
jgi:hypothetical protein